MHLPLAMAMILAGANATQVAYTTVSSWRDAFGWQLDRMVDIADPSMSLCSASTMNTRAPGYGFGVVLSPRKGGIAIYAPEDSAFAPLQGDHITLQLGSQHQEMFVNGTKQVAGLLDIALMPADEEYTLPIMTAIWDGVTLHGGTLTVTRDNGMSLTMRLTPSLDLRAAAQECVTQSQ